MHNRGDPNVDCRGTGAVSGPKDLATYIPTGGKEPVWDCEYSHTLLSLMYHPLVYKTGLCAHFDENDPTRWTCIWKRRCAHAHGV